MRLVSFGAVELPQMNGVQQSPVSFRSALIPLRGGSFDNDGTSVYPESKMISVSFWVSAADVTSIDTLINDLYTEASKGRRLLVARLRNEELWQSEAKLVQAQGGADARTYFPDSLGDNMGYERLSLTFEMPYPYWLVAEDTEKFFDEGWYFNAGITFDSGNQVDIDTNTLTNDFTIDNNGGSAHENLEVTITALTGATITDVTIENLTRGESLEWSGTIATGEALVIKTLPQTIQLDGVNEYANTVLPNDQLGFFGLDLGENQFRITFAAVSGGDANILVKWSRHYLR